MFASDLIHLIDYNEKRVTPKVDAALVETVMPALRGAVNAAALAIAGEEAANPFAIYAAEALVIKRLADFLLLTDTDDRPRITPPMLGPAFVRYWFEDLS